MKEERYYQINWTILNEINISDAKKFGAVAVPFHDFWQRVIMYRLTNNTIDDPMRNETSRQLEIDFRPPTKLSPLLDHRLLASLYSQLNLLNRQESVRIRTYLLKCELEITTPERRAARDTDPDAAAENSGGLTW